MQAYVYRARVATTQSQYKVPPIASRGAAALVSGHSPLCRASVGIGVKPRAPSCRYALPSRDALATRLLGVPKILLMLCTEKNVLGSDYGAPLDAEQGDGRLEFTCLPPECDTKWTAWVVPLARGDLVVRNVLPKWVTPSLYLALISTGSTRSETNSSFVGAKGHSRFNLLVCRANQ